MPSSTGPIPLAGESNTKLDQKSAPVTLPFGPMGQSMALDTDARSHASIRLATAPNQARSLKADVWLTEGSNICRSGIHEWCFRANFSMGLSRSCRFRFIHQTPIRDFAESRIILTRLRTMILASISNVAYIAVHGIGRILKIAMRKKYQYGW